MRSHAFAVVAVVVSIILRSLFYKSIIMVASTQFSSLSPSEHTDMLLEEVAVHAPQDVADLTNADLATQEEAPGSESPPEKAPPGSDEASSMVSAGAEAAEGAWQLARELQEEDEIVDAFVTGHNKGGLLVLWNGLQGFVPASQLIGLSGLHLEEERRATLEARNGELMQLKIIEVERDTNRLIFSERATEVTASAREDLLKELEKGQVRVGVVTNLADFGAFVDLGGVEGLVHISELSWRRLTHPGDVVRPGQKLNVLVMDVDAQRGRVALSRKKLRADPWLGVEERYHPGQRVSGAVTNMADFGVFVLLEEGLEGLIHVSEIDSGDGGEAIEQMSKGKIIEAEVIYVSERKRRLSLSLCHDDGG